MRIFAMFVNYNVSNRTAAAAAADGAYSHGSPCCTYLKFERTKKKTLT